MNKYLLTALVLITALTGCVDEGEGAAVDTRQIEGAPKRHCVVEAEAQRVGEPAPSRVAPSQAQCFETFAEAISTATQGTVQLSDDATPATLELLDAEQRASLATYLIAIEYLGLYHDAYWGTMTVATSVNCDLGYVLSISNLQGYFATNGWTMNDSIGSAWTAPGCAHGYHYDYPNFGGAVIDCPSNPEWNCYYSMGAMNDRTSSIRWTN